MSRSAEMRRQWAAFAVWVLAASAFAALCLEGILANTATVDEFAHVPAGVSHIENGDFSVYHENPPLIRCLVALPVWLSDPVLNYRKAVVGEGLRNEWPFGVDFLLLNLGRYARLLFRARCVALALSLLCCGLIFLWAGRAFGLPAACVASLLWMTDPNIVAHSGVATVDVGAAAVATLAAYVYWFFLRDPTWPVALLSAVCLGLALASKFTLMALVPAFGLVFLCTRALSRCSSATPGPRGATRPSWAQAAAIAAISVLTLDACYLFNGVGKPLNSFDFESRLLSGDSLFPSTGNRFRGTLLGRLPSPLPEDFITGFDSQKRDEECRLANLSSGRLTYGGPWYGPFRTLVFKLPPGTIVILLWSALHWARNCRRGTIGG
ncbi:MAG: ArnT family glycosyltransferase, partial [Isosphaeraceae bacterium]